MNREQKRMHWKKYRNRADTCYCPKCEHRTQHVTIPSSRSVGPQEGLGKCDIVCICCGHVLARMQEGLIAGTHVKEGKEGKYEYAR